MDNDYHRDINGDGNDEAPCFGDGQGSFLTQGEQGKQFSPTRFGEQADDHDDEYKLNTAPTDFKDTQEDGATKETVVDGRNTVWGTALAVISTIMGGGIVSIPYAYAVTGFWIGLGIQVCVIIAIWISCKLYLQTRTMLRCQTNFSTIANICMGSISSIILNLLLVFAVFGILALYMILFSEISISLIGGSYPDGHILKNKAFYVTSLCVLISPIIVRKKIQELRVSTYVLFLGVLALIILLTVLLCANGNYSTRLANGTVIEHVDDSAKKVKMPGQIEGFLDSLNIAVASQGFVIALFPIYTAMARPSRPYIMQSVTGALFFTMTTYTYLSYISISYFGQDQIAPSIFNNIKEEEGLAPVLLQCLFLAIFFCNIPFIFFAGKIAFMAVMHQCCFSKKPQTEEEFLNAETGTSAMPVSVQGSSLGQIGATSRDNMSTSFISRSIVGAVQPEDELPYYVYLGTCFSYLLIVALAAIFIDDLTLIFGIIAGLAECTTVFILPSCFYLIACSREQKEWVDYETTVASGMPAKRPRNKKGGGTITKFFVYVYLCIGVTYFGFSNYFTFAKIFK